MFDIFNVNLRKNEGFLTCIPCNPIPEYGQSNAPLVSYQLRHLLKCPGSLAKKCAETAYDFILRTKWCVFFNVQENKRFKTVNFFGFYVFEDVKELLYH